MEETRDSHIHPSFRNLAPLCLRSAHIVSHASDLTGFKMIAACRNGKESNVPAKHFAPKLSIQSGDRVRLFPSSSSEPTMKVS